MLKRAAILLAGAVLVSAAARAGDMQPEGPSGLTAQTGGTAKSFMVAAANPFAADAGYEILKRGGSATDAAVAVQMMLNLVEPQSSGIGGGAFLVHWDAKSAKLSTYDGRETAPMAAGSDYFLKPDGSKKGFWEAVNGAGSVGVPGTVAMLEMVHEAHGRLPWGVLFRSAIDRARAGFEISPRLAGAIVGAAKRGLPDHEATRAYFFAADGTPKPAGTLLKNPEFAASLEAIAADGAEAFYAGAIAERILAALATTPDNPNPMTSADLAAYRAKEREPVCIDYRGYDVCGVGPPSSGALTVGQILGMLRHFDLEAAGPGPEAAHLFAEASKLAYADRALFMADLDYVEMPMRGLLDPHYLRARAALISARAAMNKAEAGTPPFTQRGDLSPDLQPERAGTSHFVIVDGDGNAVSMTTTIETGFGSRLMAGGFLLNNELTDFSFLPEKDGKPVANRIEGGKRPRSSMAPTIVLRDGKPVILIGSPGGSRIIPYVAWALIGMIDWGMSPQDAVNLGHVSNRNGATDLEEGTAVADWAAALEAKGHEVKIRSMNSGLHAIRIDANRLVGGADPRREGTVRGD
ncbi:gamma-glutamyltransferase [Nisaea acidiphila]|uniref:Glutathione hydrolase proenzyme n=1 Tax=Nisaea acidiphila TaxID=1862145 RepID=A0A9J7AU55_9PROT|nr:gamma-glutamyltransferase [Nisaea acidiphila]UUX49852.1 gamma-glutamyltransferase [Nisaea acidiphila]